MQFINIATRSIYLTCCHRDIAPGGSFSYPWVLACKDRALTSAMAYKELAWRSEAGELEIPGSPAWPKPQEVIATASSVVDPTAAIKRRKSMDDAIKANMSKMGKFKVPAYRKRTAKAQKVNDTPVIEEVFTEADVIKDDNPISIADIKRHNKAVKSNKKKA